MYKAFRWCAGLQMVYKACTGCRGSLHGVEGLYMVYKACTSCTGSLHGVQSVYSVFKACTARTGSYGVHSLHRAFTWCTDAIGGRVVGVQSLYSVYRAFTWCTNHHVQGLYMVYRGVRRSCSRCTKPLDGVQGFRWCIKPAQGVEGLYMV